MSVRPALVTPLLGCVAALILAATGCTTSVGSPSSDGPAAAQSLPAAGSTSDPADAVPEVVEKGFSSWKVELLDPLITYTSFAVLIRNPNPGAWVAGATRVTITFRDSTGAVVASDTSVNTYGVQPGATAIVAKWVRTKSRAVATSMDVQLGTTDWSRTDKSGPDRVTAGPATTRPSGFGLAKLTIACDVTSTSTSTLRASIDVAYRDAGGAIIGGGEFFNNIGADPINLPGSSTTPVQLLEFTPPPAGVPAAECYPSFQPH